MHPKLMELLFQYPGLRNKETKFKDEGICLKGVLKINNHCCRISLNCPHFPQLREMQLQLLWYHCVQSGGGVQSYTSADAGIQPDWTVSELLENLAQFQPPEESNNSGNLTAPPHESIYAQIAALYAPDCYELHMDANCTRVRFSKFAEFEQHFLELQVQPALQVVDHSLPDCGVPAQWQEDNAEGNSEGVVAGVEGGVAGATVATLLQQFQTQLQQLLPFYANFTDIDELCYVVQPAPTTTKHNWRLFLLRDRVFLKLHIGDPLAPFASLSLHILGPTHEVEQLRRVYSEGLRNWDAELDIHKNLLRIFDLCFFPMPPSSEDAAAADASAAGDGADPQSCNICYCYQLEEGEIPIVSCDNPKCSVIFHAACLKQWFNTLSDGKVFLDVSFGACPFCKTKLSASFGELLKN